MNNIFKGIITALITPFKNEKFDLIALEKLIEHQIINNIDGLVIAGSTGEGSSINQQEYKILLEYVIKIVKGRVPVIAGCCASSTNVALKLASICQEVAVDGIMCTTPPYTKPTNEGIFQHIKAIHETTTVPIIIYNNYARTGVELTDEVIIRLAELPRVAALKDTGFDLTRPFRLREQIKQEFNFLTGEDTLSLAYNVQRGKGCISVASNIAPKLCKQLQESWQSNHIDKAQELYSQLLLLYEALSLEPNPIAVKYGVSYLGLCDNELRLPLVKASSNTRIAIEKAIATILL